MRRIKARIIKSAVAIALAVTTAVTSAAVITPITAEASYYDQRDAYKLLGYVNNLRKSGNAWQRDENDEVVYMNNLRSLQWSDTLTYYAKKRTLQIVPKNDFFEIDTRRYLPSKYHTHSAEILARYFRSSWSVFKRWRHTYDDYDGQASRRKMLSPNVSYLGAACYVSDSGNRYYVMIVAAVGNSSGQGTRKQNVGKKLHLTENGQELEILDMTTFTDFQDK